MGGRSTDESKYVFIEATTFPAGGPSVNELEGTADANETSFLVNLAWSFSDNSMTYLQFSDGFRNGGFPARTPAGFTVFQEARYDEEFVDSWELGLKTTALDGKLRANIALFSSEYTDMQINATVFDPALGNNVGTIQNVGDSSIRGLELELNYLVNDNFRLDASIGMLDTELDSISTDNGEFILNNGNNMQKTITKSSGVELPHAPELQANLGANFSFFVGNGGEIRNRLDYFYEAEQYSSIGNYKQGLIPSTSRVNYTVSYIPDSAKWEATLGVRNLTDEEDILNTAIETGPRAGVYHVHGRGREAYVQFKYSFGD